MKNRTSTYKEIFLYLVFGGLTTFVNFIIFDFLIRQLNWDWLYANTLAWCIAVIFAYTTNALFVFNSSGDKAKREFISFVFARVLSLIMETIVLWITIHLFSMNPMLSKLLCAVLVIVVNYLSSKLFIFSHREGKAHYVG